MMKNHSEDRRDRAVNVLAKAGYGAMKHLATDAVHQHEDHDHKGEKKTKLKLANGGCASGGKPDARLDRKPRAAGGRNSHKEPKVSVNVINAGKQPVPVPMGGPMGAPPAGAAPMPPHPPMAPPGQPGMPPPGGMPGAMPQRPFKGGGPVRDKGNDMPHLEGGAGGGLGRLEKAAHEQKRKKMFAK